jgi:hypothetical protein
VIASLELGETPTFKRLPGASWRLMVHRLCDGVTSGSWWCGTSFYHEVKDYPRDTGRRLKHILSAMPLGWTISTGIDVDFSSPRPFWTKEGFHFGGLLPLKSWAANFIAPSVHKKWATRALTPEELCYCWDIGLDQLRDLSVSVVTAAVPAKILLVFGQGLNQSEFNRRELEQPSLPGHETEEMRSDSSALTHGFTLEDSLMPFPEMEGRQRAAKNDDAEIPVEYWDGPFWTALARMGRQSSFINLARSTVIGKDRRPILDVLRGWLLSLWRVLVWKSFRHFLKTSPPAERSSDISAGWDCLSRVGDATFWDWSSGSRLFFWRWPQPLRVWAWDGLPVYAHPDLPVYKKIQPPPKDQHTKKEVASKLSRFVERGYISQGSVTSLISYFSVPKGESDIRLVFDGTQSGLNSKLWAPSFCLPSIESLLPMLEPGTWQSDIDVGEQFYNFLLHPTIRPFCGIDFDPYLRPSGQQTRVPWMQWQRCVMGLATSPHGCVKMQMLAEELVRGNPCCPFNPFFFDLVRLNLPGSERYDPSIPRVSKVDSRSGRLAADMSTYVDNVRNTGSSALHCWQTSHRISTHFCYLGIQDTLCKCTMPRLLAGAWTGSIAQSRDGQVIVTCTEEKWSRAREYVFSIQSTLLTNQSFHHKTLEQQRGFLVYIARTFPSLVPYLKGVHLTLDSWRAGRDSEGWKSYRQVNRHLTGTDDAPVYLSNPPELVTAVPQLSTDVEGLLTLFASPAPPIRVVRARTIVTVYYGFGDALGSSFGDTIMTSHGVLYRCGIWGDDLKNQSSNYRELFNLTEAMEAHVSNFTFPHLQHLVSALKQSASMESWISAEIFLFTDNAVAESAFYKGTSSNRLLFELVLRLRKLECVRSAHAGSRDGPSLSRYKTYRCFGRLSYARFHSSSSICLESVRWYS